VSTIKNAEIIIQGVNKEVWTSTSSFVTVTSNPNPNNKTINQIMNTDNQTIIELKEVVPKNTEKTSQMEIQTD
jgi:hypothetical protein